MIMNLLEQFVFHVQLDNIALEVIVLALHVMPHVVNVLFHQDHVQFVT